MKTIFCLIGVFIVFSIIPNVSIAQDTNRKEQSMNDPEMNFEYLWKTYDANYALFKAKSIDWQALYNIYRPMVNSKTSDDELFKIMSKLIGHLNDNHVRLQTSNRFFGAGFLFDFFKESGLSRFRKTMRSRPPVQKYLKSALKETGNGIFAYGWLNDDFGYFHFNSFGDLEQSAKAIDEIIAEFKNAKSIIVDVRRNGGGDDRVGKLIADRFADTKRLYMTTQDRNGKKYDDFDQKKYWFVEPNGPNQFTKAVILLTNRLSISAAENFTLAMRVLPHVTVVGDFTSGCFADVNGMRLPNGWNFSYSQNLFLDYKGFCWEGIGVPPDIKISVDYNDTLVQNDLILETSIALLKSGKLSLQDESESLKKTKSLVEIFKKEIEKIGIKKAVEIFRERYSIKTDDNYYMDTYELISLNEDLSRGGKKEESKEILSLLKELIPYPYEIYNQISLDYFKENKIQEGIETLRKAISIILKRSGPFSRQFNIYLYDEIVIALFSEGYKGLLEKYDALKNEYPLRLDENFLNSLGYVLLNNDLIEKSISVFKLNVEKYPISSNVYDSLGEAYMKAGNNKLAIGNYEKSVELNPNNTGAIAQLKKLKEK